MHIKTNLRHISHTLCITALLVLLPASSLVTLISMSRAYAEPQTGISKIGTIGSYFPTFASPAAMGIDNAGNMYISSTGDNVIHKLSASGDFLFKFGGYGTEEGKVSQVTGIAFDSNNNVYIADSGNNSRIQKFDSTGNYISQWGTSGGITSGDGDGQFNQPTSIASDSLGNYYVADSLNHRIQKFDANGTFISKFGTEGSADGELYMPKDVAIDASNNVYVVDAVNHRIQKFDANGTFISKFGTEGSGNGQFSGQSSLKISPTSGELYVTDPGNHRIQKFDANGTFISKFGTEGSGNGQFCTPAGGAFDAQGNFYVTDRDCNRVQKFAPNNTFISVLTSEANKGIIMPYDVKTDSAGNTYIISTGNGRIVKVNSGGDVDHFWASEGDNFPAGLAVHGDYAYTVQVGDDDIIISKTDLEGTVLGSWEPGANKGFGVTTDTNGDIYFTNATNNSIQKFNSDGALLAEWGEEGTEDGQFMLYDFPAYPATDSQNNVYIPDTGNYRIQKFDSSGNFITAWGEEGTEDGQFTVVSGVTVDSAGNVYVTDAEVGNVQKFTNNGEFLGKYTQDPDEATGQPFYPVGISVGINGRIYVANVLGGRIEVLCDHDVSANNCEAGSVAEPKGENTIPNAADGKKVYFAAPDGSVLTNFTSVSASSVVSDMEHVKYTYPLGLVTFTLSDIDVGATKQVELYFATDLKPSDVVPRKYNTATKTYQDIPGVTVSSAEKEGVSALKVSYAITDGGTLDQDGVENGTIVDPIGLAVEDGGLLANTGILAGFGVVVGLLMITGAAYTYIDYRKHKKPLIEADREIARTYTYWHHLRVVSVPMFKYRISVALEKRDQIGA